jgi:hypothetical protein
MEMAITVFTNQKERTKMTTGRLVTALEILRMYAEAYASASFTLALASNKCRNDGNALNDGATMGILQGELERLRKHCEPLPVTAKKIDTILTWLNNPQSFGIAVSASGMSASIVEVHSRMVDELSTKVFFQIPYERERMFSRPLDGWEEIIARWDNVRTDVEEMHKCFALSRYAAAVFHSVQVIECGLIHLGVFLRIKDPKSGWTAVSNKLDQITKTKRENLDDFEKQNFPLIEQMQGVVTALKNAWRNKISHSEGKLVLMTSEFSPDIAEEIMIASRSFMRRLATEMP